MNRREFLQGLAIGAGAGGGLGLGARAEAEAEGAAGSGDSGSAVGGGVAREYRGPNVILVRFGGGVRRRETIDAEAEFAPFLKTWLAPRGVLFPRMEISSNPKVETSHGQGTMHLLTGTYDQYGPPPNPRFLDDRYEAFVPTIFEGLRKAYAVPEHQALLINGEDRIGEEFYSFSNHHLFGVRYRCTVLSLYRFKVHLLRRSIERGDYRKRPEEEAERRAELEKLERLDYRAEGRAATSPELEGFWEEWEGYYGKSGLVNPRGDQVLAELAARAMRRLQPRLMMINFQDPDYVHWGNAAFYTRAVTIVDECLRRLREESDRLEAYRGRTVFLVVPDCGRDSNPLMAVPYQHHFNSASSRRIFLAAEGPGIDAGRVVDKRAEQISVAATVGAIMGFETPHAQERALAEVFS